MCLATMAYVYAASTLCVTIFSTGGKLSNFTEMLTLTQAACSCALLFKQQIRCYLVKLDKLQHSSMLLWLLQLYLIIKLQL